MLSFMFIFYFSFAAKADDRFAKRDTVNNIKTTGKKDGSTYDKAIVITETTEGAGGRAEYAWIKQNYPGSRPHSQALIFHEKRTYDIINITTADGKEVAIYFDITNFYGKF